MFGWGRGISESNESVASFSPHFLSLFKNTTCYKLEPDIYGSKASLIESLERLNERKEVPTESSFVEEMLSGLEIKNPYQETANSRLLNESMEEFLRQRSLNKKTRK